MVGRFLRTWTGSSDVEVGTQISEMVAALSRMIVYCDPLLSKSLFRAAPVKVVRLLLHIL